MPPKPRKTAAAKKTAAAPRKPRDAREALRRRQTKVTHYDIPVRSLDEALEAKRELVTCQQTLTAALYVTSREESEDNKAAVAKSRAAMEQAQKAVDDCFWRLEIHGIPEDEFDAFVQLHPPSDEQLSEAQRKGEDPPLWNRDSLMPALLERCAQDSSLSEKEWSDELATWTAAERAELWRAVLDANIRSFSRALADFG